MTPIRTATDTAGQPITAGLTPGAIAVTPDGKIAYVVDSASNTVIPIHTATNSAGSAIPAGTTPIQAAITPSGSTLYVVHQVVP